jgi:hypothetical protein
MLPRLLLCGRNFSPLLALKGHADGAQQCLLLRVKRTSKKPPTMSAYDPIRKSDISFCCGAQSDRSSFGCQQMKYLRAIARVS